MSARTCASAVYAHIQPGGLQMQAVRLPRSEVASTMGEKGTVTTRSISPREPSNSWFALIDEDGMTRVVLGALASFRANHSRLYRGSADE